MSVAHNYPSQLANEEIFEEMLARLDLRVDFGTRDPQPAARVEVHLDRFVEQRILGPERDLEAIGDLDENDLAELHAHAIPNLEQSESGLALGRALGELDAWITAAFDTRYTNGPAKPAQLYVTPLPVPEWVGHTYMTYQPLQPPEGLNPHSRRYNRFNVVDYAYKQ